MTKIIDLNRLMEDYGTSKARIILLDYEGTLVPFDLHHELARPSPYVKESLYQLATDPKNNVVLISGREKEYLDAQWWSLPITLVAEHGGYYRGYNDDWREMFSRSDAWISKTLPALNALALHYEGSIVESKSYSIAWHYRAIKDKVTEEDKRQILSAIRTLPEHDHFQIYDSEFDIELRTVGIDKGSFVSHWIGNRHHDFIMAIGDDQTDEDLFKILGKEAYSIKVGRSLNSHANFHLLDQKDVLPLLQTILEFERVTSHKAI